MATMKNITGERRGRLVIIEQAYRTEDNIYMKCKCDCGNSCYVSRKQLLKKRGGTLSCGCIRSEKSSERIRSVKPYMYNRQNANKAKAIDAFNRSIAHLAVEYDIPQDVVDSYCRKFRTSLGLQPV